MRVLVTGGGGFAGQHLLRAILEKRPEAVAATVLEEPPQWPADHPFSAVEWLSLDLGSEAAIREVVHSFKPDTVYHLAGQASVGESLDNPVATWEVNATGTMRLLVALLSSSPPIRRFLLASSAEVYGRVPAEQQPIQERTLVHPITPYGSSKAAAEMVAIQMCQAAGVEVVVARSFNHIGPGQDQRFVLPNLAVQLAKIRRGTREPVLRVGNLEVQRDFLDVRDAVRGYVLLMDRATSGEVYNVSSGQAQSLSSVVNRLIQISGANARLEIDPGRVRPIDIPLLLGDSGKLRHLGWRPEYDLDATVHDLLSEAETRA